MAHRDPYDMSVRMRQIEESWNPPTPEMEQKCLQVLKENDALDVAPMLGLEVPA